MGIIDEIRACFSKRNKGVVLDREDFRYQSVRDQAINYIWKHGDTIDYKKFVLDVLSIAKLEDIVKLMNFFYDSDSSVFQKLEKALSDLVFHPYNWEKSIYACALKEENELYENISIMENSLNVGDQIAYLLHKYKLTFNNEKYEFVKIINNNLRSILVVKIKQKIAFFENVIESQSSISIENALHLFFLYEKEVAFTKFKRIIETDKVNRRFTMYQLHHSILATSFFDKIDLDYIPSIDTTSDIYDIILSPKEESISKKEIIDFIDREDFFNKRVPLIGYPKEKLINPFTDIVNNGLVRDCFIKIYEKCYIELRGEKSYTNLEWNIGEIFYDSITEPYPKHPEFQLIYTRELTKELLQNKKNSFEKYFFSTIYILKSFDLILKWNTKFPPLFEEYIGSLHGFRKDSIKKYFLNDEKNNIFSDYMEVKIFLANNVSNELAKPIR